MNVYALETRMMLAHSDAWLGSAELQGALAPDPVGEALLGKLRLAHDDLARRQQRRARLEQLAARLTRELSALDSIHNGAIRAIYYHLTALSWSCRDGDQARDVLALRDLLFPEGLAIVNRSYLSRSGAAVELARRVTSDVRARLAAMPFDGRTLADLYDELIATGAALGRLVQRRAGVLASMSGQGSEAAAVDLGAGRRRWGRVVSFLLENLRLMDVSPVARELIVAPLAQSIAKARRRRHSDDPSDDPSDHAIGDPDRELPGSASGHGRADGDLTGGSSRRPADSEQDHEPDDRESDGTAAAAEHAPGRAAHGHGTWSRTRVEAKVGFG